MRAGGCIILYYAEQCERTEFQTLKMYLCVIGVTLYNMLGHYLSVFGGL